jgi:hypothetical protein
LSEGKGRGIKIHIKNETKRATVAADVDKLDAGWTWDHERRASLGVGGVFPASVSQSFLSGLNGRVLSRILDSGWKPSCRLSNKDLK